MSGRRAVGIMLIGMAEFWAFMGKARGFTVGVHSQDSLEILGQDTEGESTFSRFEPGTSRS